MKKFLVVVLTMSVLCFSLVGCGSSPATLDNGDDPNSNQQEELKKDEKPKKEETPKITLGETISDDRAEITINKIEFSYDVLPDDTSSFYTHYAAESGEVYVHIDADVKNIQKQNLSCDEIMDVMVDYNDGYEYVGFPVPEDSSTGFTYANIVDIKPLSSQGLRYLVTCPQEVADSQNPVKVNFDINGTIYEYVIR